MDNKDLGRVPAEPGSREPDPQAVPALSGLDPSRDELLGALLRQVWLRARGNHERYSATGSYEDDLRFLALGLTGEAGELANFIKKRWRDGVGHTLDIQKEIADVLAYAFMLADRLALTPFDLLYIVNSKQDAFITKMEALSRSRDSDGSPKGGDACGSVHDSAGRNGIAPDPRP